MSYNQQQQHYGHQQAVVPVYAEHGEYADIDEPAVAETRPNIFPASHPLFTREEISNTRTLDPYPSTQSPQSWTPYEPPFRQQPLSYAPYPSPSPFPPPRLSPPPSAHTQTFHFKAPGQSVSPGSANHRLTLAGSLDPATGIFYRTPEHPRLRTAQACEKCRTRKAKCSGEHPSCKRCITRGLVCEYAKEGRVRGPNKPKPKINATSTASPTSSTSIAASAARNSETTPTSSKTGYYGARAGPHRSQSSHSSGGSSDETPMEASSHSLFLPTSPGGRDVQSSRSEHPYRQSVSNSPPLSSPSFLRGRRPGIDSRPIPSTNSRHSSLGEHPSPRSHLMDFHLEPASSLYRISGDAGEDAGRSRLGSSSRGDIRASDIVPGMAVRSLPPDTHLYPYQHPLQPQDQQRDAPEHGYLSETIDSRQRQSYRYHQPDQPGQPFQTQRDLFSLQPADFPSAGTSQLHALSPVSIAQSRRMMSETGPVPAQGQQSFPPPSHIASHQQFVSQQPQQHRLVPIQLGLNIPGDHHPVRRQEHSGELAYPELSTAGVSFFHAHGQHSQPGRGPESTTHGHHGEYQLHDPYRQHQAQHQQQRGFPSQNESEMAAAAVQMHYAGHRPRTDFQMERAHFEESPASYPPRRTVSSTSSNRDGSPMTPASAATSESEMLLYHYTATGSAPSGLDPDMHEMQPAGATTSLASVTSLHSQPSGTQRPSAGGEMHPGHTGVDVEGESRLADIAAVQQRGNGHDLSVSGSLTTNLASNETETIDHSLAGRGYGNEIQILPESTGTEEDVFRREHPGFPGAMRDMEFC